MFYILDQKRGMSIPIKDDYVIYIRRHADKELYDIMAGGFPQLSGIAKTEYFLGRYFDEKLATEAITHINKARSTGYGYYTMPEDTDAYHHVCTNPDYCDI